MIKIAKYFTITLLAVFTIMTGGVPSTGASEILPHPSQWMTQTGDEEIPTFQEWRWQLIGNNGQDVKACIKVCKTKGTKCKRKCYGTADDIACKAECTAVRAVCYKVCKGEKPQPPK